MRTPYNQLVGKIDNQYYVLEDTFIHDNNFKGATGCILVPVTRKEYEERMTFGDLMTNIWVYDIFDTSNYSIGKTIAEIYNSELPEDTPEDEKAEFCECIGCGRIFSHELEFDKIYNQELIDEIKEFEKD